MQVKKVTRTLKLVIVGFFIGVFALLLIPIEFIGILISIALGYRYKKAVDKGGTFVQIVPADPALKHAFHGTTIVIAEHMARMMICCKNKVPMYHPLRVHAGVRHDGIVCITKSLTKNADMFNGAMWHEHCHLVTEDYKVGRNFRDQQVCEERADRYAVDNGCFTGIRAFIISMVWSSFLMLRPFMAFALCHRLAEVTKYHEEYEKQQAFGHGSEMHFDPS
jgi:hypothetical protein